MGMIQNWMKTALLLGLLSGLLLFVGQLVGGVGGLTVALVFALVMNIGSYFFSHQLVLWMYQAKPADPKKHKFLFDTVAEICKKMNLPMPKVYIIPSTSCNAFATGRNPEHAVVACTEGILKILTKDELKGVLAHECSHVKNRDILIATIAATIAAVISYAAAMARWAAIFGGFGNRDRQGGSNILEFLVLAIITPILAVIIQLAISRSREYLADHSGAKCLGNGESLARALEKLEAHNKVDPLRFGNRSTASLFITNPFKADAFLTLFSTHPSTKARVERLRGMKF